jgi:hypothetical protein
MQSTRHSFGKKVVPHPSGAVGSVAGEAALAASRRMPRINSINASGVIDHVVATNNSSGIVIDISGYNDVNVSVTVSNGVASNNGSTGMYFNTTSGNLLVADVDLSSASNNYVGIDGEGTAVVLLGRSVVTGNVTGVKNGTSGGTFNTYGDNRINWNHPTDISSPMNTTADTPR